MMRLKKPLILLPVFLAIFLVSLGLVVSQASARPASQGATSTPTAPAVDNTVCLACHSKPAQQYTLPSGEALYITIDPQTFQDSVHGKNNVACVSCHTNITGYPHPALQAQTLRDVTILLNQGCAACHKSEAQQTHDGAHAKLLAEGNKNAAVCTDCHGAHNTQPPGEPRSSIPQTCNSCHSQIYSLYKDSVHGAALIGEGNPDVPSCVDCHGVHNIQGPVNSEFRLYSPNICAKCHANQQLMDKYHINTDVFNTYLTDFHGTTVQMFQSLAPGQATNKPVCIDCHGVHDIKAVTDPNSTVIKENILATCKKCHPDATTNFPGAWLSHFPPSPTHNSIVFYVQSFYKIFIPTVIGGMAIFVVADAGRRIVRRREGRRNE